MAAPVSQPPVIGSGPPPWPRSPAVAAGTTRPLRLRVPPAVRILHPPPLPRRQSLLTPSELERFKNLLAFARSTVEGYFIGKHRSPNRGTSVEFADYKEYAPGDAINQIDWRAYGRARRLYIRQREAETDMVVYLLLDVSASMSYTGAGRQSKYILAAKIAAALAYLMIHQGDKASLSLFAQTLNQFQAPGGTLRHLNNLVNELDRVQPASTTGIAQALRECSPLFKKRGRIVILSDFWTDPDEFFDALGQFLHRKFEILLLHVLDPDELNLPAANAARFQDMETSEEVEVEPDEIRAAFRENVRQRLENMSREATLRCVSHALVNTQRPYLDAIESYLGFRGRNTLSRR